MSRYVYLGDRMTHPRFVGQSCDPVYRADRTPVTVIVGRRPRNQLVVFPWGEEVVVLGRRLRLTPEAKEARNDASVAAPGAATGARPGTRACTTKARQAGT